MVMQDTFGPGQRAVPGQAAQDVIAATAFASGVLGRVIGMSAVVVAFGLGLADRSPGIGAGEPDAMVDGRAQPVAWPAPTGDSAG
jgi:hypothetical protein